MPEDIANLFSLPHSLCLSLSIGTCVLPFASLILPTTCSSPICLVTPLFSHPSLSSTLPSVKVQTWRKVVSTKRSGQHLHLHFHLHLHLHLPLHPLSFSPSPVPSGTCLGCLFMHDLIGDWHRGQCFDMFSILPLFLATETGQTKVNCLTLNYENDRRHNTSKHS